MSLDLSDLEPRQREVIGKSAGPAFFASLHHLCGSPRVAEFETAWIRHLTREIDLTPAEQTVVRGFFSDLRERPLSQSSTTKDGPAIVEAFCARSDFDPSVIERGIAGDFSEFVEMGRKTK